jgi:hypothetical protein
VKSKRRRRTLSGPRLLPVVAAVVQPVARRLSRIEDLLVEMRCEQDVQLKRVAALHAQLENIADEVRANAKTPMCSTFSTAA